MPTFDKYAYLIRRCQRWSLDDLGDLLFEVNRDKDLDEEGRRELQQSLYELIWDRAQLELKKGAGDAGAGEPLSPPNGDSD